MRDNWDDLRFVLAVAEAGSVSGAARVLGVNHATVLRRIAAFESGARVALFDKSPHGYDVPAAQRRIIDAARDVEQAVQAVRRVLQGVRAPLSGEIRVTTTDTLCLCVMPEVLSQLREKAPELRVDLICSNAHADLARTQAEIALRPALNLSEDLVGDSPARLGFAAFGPRGEPATTGWAFRVRCRGRCRRAGSRPRSIRRGLPALPTASGPQGNGGGRAGAGDTARYPWRR